MSRRGGGGGVRGPSSALTAFLRDQGIDTSRPMNPYRRRDQLEEQDNTEAGSSTAGPSNAAAPRPTAARSNSRSGYNSDNLDESDGGDAGNRGKKKKSKAELGKAKAKAAARKRKRGEDDDDDDYEDEEDEYTAPSRGGVAAGGRPPDVGSFENCAECGKRFTVATGKDPFKKPAAPRKRKVPAEKRKVVNFEEDDNVKSLATMCIEMLSKHIDDIEALGNIGSLNMDAIAKIICKNRKLTPENVQLFYDVRNSDLTFMDVTGVWTIVLAPMDHMDLKDCAHAALQPPALMTLASLNPKLESLRLDLCGRMTDEVLGHYATQFTLLRRIELLGPFLVRKEGWAKFLEAVGPRLEGFLVTQSPRFDVSCLEALVQHIPPTQLKELRLSEFGNLKDEWLPSLAAFTQLTYLDLSYSTDSLTDEPVVQLLSAVGANLRHLDLSGHVLLTDKVLVDGIGRHTTVLESLSLCALEQLTDVGVAQLFKELPPEQRLRHADFTRNHALADEALQALLMHSGSALVELSINSWKETSSELLMDVAQYLPRIVYLDVGWCRGVDDFVVKAVLDGCPDLKTVKCYGCNRVTANCPKRGGVRIFGVESHSVMAN
ncbi:hypothetical protein FRB99_003962 [Tulasnella sp. 403]|nr:hypothetical protein FRB99_003962 [Tulasnella sp. 403]